MVAKTLDRGRGRSAMVRSAASQALDQGTRWQAIFLSFFLSLIGTFVVPAASSFDATIHGCGGFVVADPSLAQARNPSEPKLDYSDFAVELRTLDGLVKDRVQCAPNGYYFLPVYDKGTFILEVKGPSGWSWDPSHVTVVADHSGCNGNEDINFRYTGFTLSGKVVGAVGGASCRSQGEGPSRVSVRLAPLKNQEEPHVIDTNPGGSFKFVNIIPDTYKLQAYHPKLTVDLKGPAEVNLGFGNMDLGDIFYIPGYKVEGSVVSQGNPVLGVHVYLYSDDVAQVTCPEGLGNLLPAHAQALCHAVSDANGKFGFSLLPCGEYKLVPYYKGEVTVFDVSPVSMEVVVTHDNVILANPFQVTGFSVGGRVIDSQGEGIEGVEILVNDVRKAVTDAGGSYKLDQVTSAQYTIKAQKTHFKFSTLDNFMVLPNIGSLPNIVASHYELCGSIMVDRSTHPGKRQVALTHGPANVRPQTKFVDEKGSFCFEVPPGEYRLSPITSPVEQQSGLVFAPQFIDVVASGPVLDVVLTQARVAISGSVKCINVCASSVMVSLIPFVPGTSKVDTSKLRVTSLTAERSSFFFDKVLPGKYQLTVRNPPPSEVPGWDDEWCWQESTLEKDVGTSDLVDIQFLQKGFSMAIHSTHSAEASIRQPNGKVVAAHIEKGWQQECVEVSGIHELDFPKSCVSFGIFPVQYDTSDPRPIKLVGEKYVLTGKINLQGVEHISHEELADNVVILVWAEDDSFVDSNNRLRLTSDGTGSTATLEYIHWAHLGDRLVFIPKDVRGLATQGSNKDVVTTTKQFLFYPKQHHVYVQVDGCQPEIPSLVGRPGLYIKGFVTPPLEGVDITIMTKSESSDGTETKGDIVMVVNTSEDGSYTAGPLYDDAEYNVEAAKVGYYLKPLGDSTFSCQKLGQIIVRILPGEGAEDQLPSVLLSLSGDNGFRKNAVTGPGGAYIFDSLFPGSFYLRPLLKEYSFLPASDSIDLESGSTVEVTFTALHISYSVHGAVTSLTGIPEEGVTLEARSESRGFYEESITDSQGRFRLRGLLPHTSYIVKVVLKEDARGIQRIERASPPSYTVQVAANDTTGLDFVVFDQPSTSIITGSAEGEGLHAWMQYLTVRVVSVGDGSKFERVIPLPSSSFFEIQGLPKGKYSVQLMLGLSEKTHKFQSQPVEVDLERHPQVHIGPLRFLAAEWHQKHEFTPAPVLPIIVGLMVIIMFASLPRLKDAYQWAFGSGLSNTAAVQPKKEARKLTLRKRTY